MVQRIRDASGCAGSRPTAVVSPGKRLIANFPTHLSAKMERRRVALIYASTTRRVVKFPRINNSRRGNYQPCSVVRFARTVGSRRYRNIDPRNLQLRRQASSWRTKAQGGREENQVSRVKTSIRAALLMLRHYHADDSKLASLSTRRGLNG